MRRDASNQSPAGRITALLLVGSATVLLVAGAACVTPGPAGGWTPAPYSPLPPPDRGFEDDGDDDATPPPPPSAAPVPASTTSASAAPASSTAHPDGAACSKGSDCVSGVCEGQGCEPAQGKCAPATRPCSGGKAPFCDCQGKTVMAAKSCPAIVYAHAGACK